MKSQDSWPGSYNRYTTQQKICVGVFWETVILFPLCYASIFIYNILNIRLNDTF